MSAGKWIGGILGFMSGGALGALAGVALGALFDYGLKAVNKDEDGSSNGFTGGNANVVYKSKIAEIIRSFSSSAADSAENFYPARPILTQSQKNIKIIRLE